MLLHSVLLRVLQCENHTNWQKKSEFISNTHLMCVSHSYWYLLSLDFFQRIKWNGVYIYVRKKEKRQKERKQHWTHITKWTASQSNWLIFRLAKLAKQTRNSGANPQVCFSEKTEIWKMRSVKYKLPFPIICLWLLLMEKLSLQINTQPHSQGRVLVFPPILTHTLCTKDFRNTLSA